MFYSRLHSRLHSRPSAVGFAVLLLAFSSLTACGKKGDPLPPLRDNPARSEDLKVAQQGDLLLLEMTYPTQTVDGMPLPLIDGIEVLELVKVALGDVAPSVDPMEMEGVDEPLLIIRGAELQSALTQNRIQIRVPLAADLPEEPSAHYYAVRTMRGETASELSNVASIIPMKLPEPPSELRAEARADGVALSWNAAATTAEGYEVYRRSAQDRGYGAALTRVAGDVLEFVDESAEYGNRYVYTVRVIARLAPLTLSGPAGEREIDFVDRFAPPLPTGFVGLGERGQVRLRWDASAASDVAGYILHRREPGRDFHRLQEELITATEFVDRGLASGLNYAYRIQVVDASGNLSEISEPVRVTTR